MASHLQAVGVKRPLIVTDKGVAALPMTATLANDLRAANLVPAVFAGVWGNPTASQVRAGVEAFRAHHADAIVGFGGGAALDVERLQCHDQAFSTLTRNDLNSGVLVLASPTKGVRALVR